MAARRSLVGIMSWIAAKHVDLTVSGTSAPWRFLHTGSQGVAGCSWAIRIAGGLCRALSRYDMMSYTRFLNIFLVSVMSGVATLAMSMSYLCKCTILEGIHFALGGFSNVPCRSWIRMCSDSSEFSFAPTSWILLSKRALHFAIMFGRAPAPRLPSGVEALLQES